MICMICSIEERWNSGSFFFILTSVPLLNGTCLAQPDSEELAVLEKQSSLCIGHGGSPRRRGETAKRFCSRHSTRAWRPPQDISSIHCVDQKGLRLRLPTCTVGVSITCPFVEQEVQNIRRN